MTDADLTDNIVTTLSSLERGDTFEARVEHKSGCVDLHQYEVTRVRDVGDINGFVEVERTNTGATTTTRRLYVTDDGVTVAKGWSPSETVIENISLDLGMLDSPDYHLDVSRNADGEITESQLVREDEVSASAGGMGL